MASGPTSSREAGRVAQQQPNDTLADLIPRLGEAPLEFQPGDRWSYSPSRGFDVLLRIVEIASGHAADRFLRARIFEPLGMKDTFFWAPETHRSRVVTVYRQTPQGLTRLPNQIGATSETYFSGGGGLMSTAQDYLLFGQMLLNGGELNGTQLLSPKTVELMASTFVEEFGFGRVSPGSWVRAQRPGCERSGGRRSAGRHRQFRLGTARTGRTSGSTRPRTSSVW